MIMKASSYLVSSMGEVHADNIETSYRQRAIRRTISIYRPRERECRPSRSMLIFSTEFVFGPAIE